MPTSITQHPPHRGSDQDMPQVRLGIHVTDLEDLPYDLCFCCDHFVILEDWGWDHLDDGEQDEKYDHDAIPGLCGTLSEWRQERPELFRLHEDGKIGPNSVFYPHRRGWR